MRSDSRAPVRVSAALAVLGVVLGTGLLARPTETSEGAAGRPACARAPRYDGTRFGVSLSTRTMSFDQAVRANSAEFGRLPVVRFWDTHGPLSQVWSWQDRLPRRTQLVVSFRYSPQSVLAGVHDRQIRGFFRAAPRDRTIFWNYYHEPEQGVRDGAFTPEQFRAAFRHVVDLSADFCGKHLYPTLVLMGWTVDPRSGQDWRSYFPGRDDVDVLAWDPYNGANAVPPDYQDPRALYGGALAASRSVHLPWAIAETGSALLPGDDGSGRAAWLRSVARYATRNQARFVTYFNGRDSVDFRLDDDPSRRAWAMEMQQ